MWNSWILVLTAHVKWYSKFIDVELLDSGSYSSCQLSSFSSVPSKHTGAVEYNTFLPVCVYVCVCVCVCLTKHTWDWKLKVNFGSHLSQLVSQRVSKQRWMKMLHWQHKTPPVSQSPTRAVDPLSGEQVTSVWKHTAPPPSKVTGRCHCVFKQHLNVSDSRKAQTT